MRIRLDVDSCVGHGRCYALAPRVFGPDDMGHCEVLVVEPPAELFERARAGVEACPEDALGIEL